MTTINDKTKEVAEASCQAVMPDNAPPFIALAAEEPVSHTFGKPRQRYYKDSPDIDLRKELESALNKLDDAEVRLKQISMYAVIGYKKSQLLEQEIIDLKKANKDLSVELYNKNFIISDLKKVQENLKSSAAYREETLEEALDAAQMHSNSHPERINDTWKDRLRGFTNETIPVSILHTLHACEATSKRTFSQWNASRKRWSDYLDLLFGVKKSFYELAAPMGLDSNGLPVPPSRPGMIADYSTDPYNRVSYNPVSDQRKRQHSVYMSSSGNNF